MSAVDTNSAKVSTDAKKPAGHTDLVKDWLAILKSVQVIFAGGVSIVSAGLAWLWDIASKWKISTLWGLICLLCLLLILTLAVLIAKRKTISKEAVVASVLIVVSTLSAAVWLYSAIPPAPTWTTGGDFAAKQESTDPRRLIAWDNDPKGRCEAYFDMLHAAGMHERPIVLSAEFTSSVMPKNRLPTVIEAKSADTHTIRVYVIEWLDDSKTTNPWREHRFGFNELTSKVLIDSSAFQSSRYEVFILVHPLSDGQDLDRENLKVEDVVRIN